MAVSRSFSELLGDDVVAAHGLAREAQEHLAVGAQGFARERVEGAAQTRFGLLQRGDAIAFGFRVRLAPHPLAFERDLQRLLLAARANRGNEKAERDPDERAR